MVLQTMIQEALIQRTGKPWVIYNVTDVPDKFTANPAVKVKWKI